MTTIELLKISLIVPLNPINLDGNKFGDKIDFGLFCVTEFAITKLISVHIFDSMYCSGPTIFKTKFANVGLVDFVSGLEDTVNGVTFDEVNIYKIDNILIDDDLKSIKKTRQFIYYYILGISTISTLINRNIHV